MVFVDIFFHVHPVGVGADLSCPYPRNSPKWCSVFPLFVLQSVIFCRLQPIVFVDDAGAMNRPLRLSECTLRIYCVINNPCRMHAAVYFTQRISHFVAEQNNLFASVLMLNHCLLLLFLSPMEQLFKVGKVFFHNHTYALCVERVTCKVSIVGSVVEV